MNGIIFFAVVILCLLVGILASRLFGVKKQNRKKWRDIQEVSKAYIGQLVFWSLTEKCFYDKDLKQIPLLSEPNITVPIESSTISFVPCKIKRFKKAKNGNICAEVTDVPDMLFELRIRDIDDSAVYFAANDLRISRLPCYLFQRVIDYDMVVGVHVVLKAATIGTSFIYFAHVYEA